MSKVAQTQFGTGRVVEESRDRMGKVSYKVQGDGWETWVEAASILPDLDPRPTTVDYENSTTLPYNPRPQYPSNIYTNPLGDQSIDADERLHPADSVTWDERPYSEAPGPAPHLFAQSSLDDEPYGMDPRFASVPEDLDKDSITARLRNDPVRFAQDLQQAHHAASDSVEPRVAAYYEASVNDENLRTAAWKDVRAKALRLRSAGQVEPIGVTPESIYAYVMGDNGVYETIVVRGAAFTGSNSITEWDCTCEWGKWAFQRQHTYVGRLCSHAYAAYLEMQSQHQRKDKGNAWYASREVQAEDGTGNADGGAVGSDDGGQAMGYQYDPNQMLDENSTMLAGRAGHGAPDGYLTNERGSLDFDVHNIYDKPDVTHHQNLEDNRGLIGASIGVEAAIIDIERVSDPEDQALLDRLRSLSGEGNRPQKNDARNRELRRLVQLLHDRGYNAENLTAALEVREAASEKQARGELLEPAHHEPFNGSGRAEPITYSTSEQYVKENEMDHRELVVAQKSASQISNEEYVRERLGKGPAPEANETGDHGFREASLADIQSFGSEDPLGGSGGDTGGGIRTAGSGGGLDENDPALAMFSTVEMSERTAAAPGETDEDPLAYLLGGGSNHTAAADDGDDLSHLMEGMPRTAGRSYSFKEQEDLINEASADGAPFDQSSLDLSGTHYV